MSDIRVVQYILPKVDYGAKATIDGVKVIAYLKPFTEEEERQIARALFDGSKRWQETLERKAFGLPPLLED